MYLDVIDLRDFYASELGGVVTRHIGASIARLQPASTGGCVLGLGFVTPYLQTYRSDAERILAFMPAPQGVLDWPPEGKSATALVAEDALPLPDSCVDFALVVHALEMSAQPPALMAELRRVLTRSGRVAIVVPNRQGLWARSDVSPFGFGRPFSRGQLRALLAETGFICERFDTALYMPASGRRAMMGMSGLLEKTGRRVWPAFCGVTLVLASKGPIEGAKVSVRPRFVRVLQPALRPKPSASIHR
jgi:SAM-dependent methyltransferase